MRIGKEFQTTRRQNESRIKFIRKLAGGGGAVVRVTAGTTGQLPDSHGEQSLNVGPWIRFYSQGTRSGAWGHFLSRLHTVRILGGGELRQILFLTWGRRRQVIALRRAQKFFNSTAWGQERGVRSGFFGSFFPRSFSFLLFFFGPWGTTEIRSHIL